MNTIECMNLKKAYQKVPVIDEMNFTIKENTITGLIGRNGAGKTTLMKIIAGYLNPTAGKVHVFGEPAYDNLNVLNNMIFIDDQMRFSPILTLSDILTEAARFYPNWNMELAKRLCHYFQFPKLQLHHHLSKGRKSTFNVIIGIASHAPLTIFDEPTTGMDAAVRKDIYRALLKDYLAHPRTMIISSHHLDELEDLLEDVLLMHDKKTLFHLPMDELQEYAVGLTGPKEIIHQWLYDKEVLYLNDVSPSFTYAVVRNNFSVEKAKQIGLEVSAVRPSDICVYVTNQSKGGIDDVFR